MTETITPEQYRARPRHKYGARKAVRDGMKFHSRAEARRWDALKLLERAGEVVMILRQVRFDLEGGVIYRADFMVFWADGNVTVEDVKGYDNTLSQTKRRMVESRYPVTIEVVK